MTWLDRLLDETPGTVPGVGTDPILEALCSTLPPEDAHDLREERAAILEHLAGLTRDEAERRAGIAPRRAVA